MKYLTTLLHVFPEISEVRPAKRARKIRISSTEDCKIKVFQINIVKRNKFCLASKDENMTSPQENRHKDGPSTSRNLQHQLSFANVCILDYG